MAEWISVKEKLPEDPNVEVLCAWASGAFGGLVRTGRYFSGMWNVFEPTHWMPLPEPPEAQNLGEKGANNDTIRS